MSYSVERATESKPPPCDCCHKMPPTLFAVETGQYCGVGEDTKTGKGEITKNTVRSWEGNVIEI